MWYSILWIRWRRRWDRSYWVCSTSAPRQINQVAGCHIDSVFCMLCWQLPQRGWRTGSMTWLLLPDTWFLLLKYASFTINHSFANFCLTTAVWSSSIEMCSNLECVCLIQDLPSVTQNFHVYEILSRDYFLDWTPSNLSLVDLAVVCIT